MPFYERIVYTGVALLAYMVMSQLPLYGIKSSDSSDPLYWLRTVLASNRGTLTELGVLPILTSGMIMQFLAAANFFRVDFSLRQDRALFSGAQNCKKIYKNKKKKRHALNITLVFAILIAASQAVLLVLAGHYGNPSDIGTVGSALLVLQLVSSSVVILLLDELLQKGYGLGSGINIFITASVSQSVFWKLLSFSSIETYRGSEYEGAIVSVFHLVGSRSSKIRALKDAFYRPDLPNAMNAIATIAMFAFTTYLLGFRVELSVKSNRMRSQRASYPIRLFYTSAMPVILQSALYANVLLVSYLLYTYFENNFLVYVLGVWGTFDDSGLLAPVGGIAYYLSAPHGLIDAVFHPIHTLIYATLTVITCAYLSKLWTDISGCSSRDVAKKLKDQQVTIAGYRDISMYKELNRVILPAASVGGATLAFMSTTADILGCIGTGSGILISVLVIFEFFEMFAREQMEGNLSMDNMMSVQ